MSNLVSLRPLGLSILLTVSTVFCVAEAGGSGTGGGSSIRCTKSGSQFPVDGWYFLDYALMKDSDGSPYVYNNNALEHLNKVKDIFESGFDIVLRTSVGIDKSNQFDPTGWKALPYSLKTSEHLPIQLGLNIPENCDKSSLKQIITFIPERVFYKDDAGLAELGQTGTAQVSFLYVHELLRYYSSNRLSLSDQKCASGSPMSILQRNRRKGLQHIKRGCLLPQRFQSSPGKA
ncbi:MAG: hypothetical protein IPK04_13405 [Bdellovibrionales bacterium]|nr:hypothetical protein [Bdellovibrionales bacterium]